MSVRAGDPGPGRRGLARRSGLSAEMRPALAGSRRRDQRRAAARRAAGGIAADCVPGCFDRGTGRPPPRVVRGRGARDAASTGTRPGNARGDVRGLPGAEWGGASARASRRRGGARAPGSEPRRPHARAARRGGGPRLTCLPQFSLSYAGIFRAFTGFMRSRLYAEANCLVWDEPEDGPAQWAFNDACRPKHIDAQCTIGGDGV